MRLFSKLLLVFFIVSIFLGCEDDNSVTKELVTRICPQCNMPLPDSNIHTAKIDKNGDVTYFDDIGCTILWARDKKLDLRKVKVRIYSNDSKKYIDPFKAHFAINKRTPMLYGFSAYEKPCEDCISFDEVIVRMLRGEHMANPKIRKQILGY